MPRYTEICRDIPRYAGIFRDKWDLSRNSTPVVPTDSLQRRAPVPGPQPSSLPCQNVIRRESAFHLDSGSPYRLWWRRVSLPSILGVPCGSDHDGGAVLSFQSHEHRQWRQSHRSIQRNSSSSTVPHGNLPCERPMRE